MNTIKKVVTNIIKKFGSQINMLKADFTKAAIFFAVTSLLVSVIFLACYVRDLFGLGEYFMYISGGSFSIFLTITFGFLIKSALEFPFNSADIRPV